jgi:hypothetical protein
VLDITKDTKRNGRMRRMQVERHIGGYLEKPDNSLMHELIDYLARRTYSLLQLQSPNKDSSSWVPASFADYLIEQKRHDKSAEGCDDSTQHLSFKALHYHNETEDGCGLHQDHTR